MHRCDGFVYCLIFHTVAFNRLTPLDSKRRLHSLVYYPNRCTSLLAGSACLPPKDIGLGLSDSNALILK
jgi:hypothetical protein